ncbi:MAG: GyrI-like domain-containing protein [Bacteroidales bacterium]|nr:GyrI-like domain-containing protein [Bacteroidales bacterium]
MEIKNLPNTYAYYRKIETNMQELAKFVGSVPSQLLEDASRKGYKIAGPQFWNYTGMDNNPDTIFQLEIAIPIVVAEDKVAEHVASIPGFQCASLMVKGPWSNLAESYEQLIAEMAQQGMQPGLQCREVYHEVDFTNPENNVTEILMSIN